eukprot:m.22299 g.22299  ORF g.22299 m.22299 type:complete len:523 (+) comp9285_c0_seq1:108-1676(+)
MESTGVTSAATSTSSSKTETGKVQVADKGKQPPQQQQEGGEGRERRVKTVRRRGEPGPPVEKRPSGETRPKQASQKRQSGGTHPHLLHVVDAATRFLLVCDPNGDLTSINTAAKRVHAKHVICIGNLGFYDQHSHVPPVDAETRREAGLDPKGDFPQFLSGEQKFQVPVYAVAGDRGDVSVVGKLRTGEYKVPNLTILDERATMRVGTVRFFGLGGSFRPTRLFDAGDAVVDSLAGRNDKLWTTLLQVGELIDLADKAAQEEGDDITRILITYQNPAHCPYISKLAKRIKADVLIAAAPLAPCNSAYFLYDVMSLPTLQHVFEEDAKVLNSIWQQVEGHVKSTGSQELLMTLSLAHQIFSTEPTDVFMKNVLHINVSSAHHKNLAMLTAESSKIGFAMTSSSLNFSSRRKSHLEGCTVALIPDIDWQSYVNEADVTSLLTNFTISKCDLPLTRSKPVLVHFATPQQAQQALTFLSTTQHTLNETPFKAALHSRPSRSYGRGGKSMRGRGRGRRLDTAGREKH